MDISQEKLFKLIDEIVAKAQLARDYAKILIEREKEAKDDGRGE